MSAEKLATSLSIDAGSPHATEDGHDFPPLTEHTYTSSHDEGTRTVVLNLFGRSKQPTAIPRVLASDGVRGSVGLSATKHFSVKSVSVEVCGVTYRLRVVVLITSTGRRYPLHFGGHRCAFCVLEYQAGAVVASHRRREGYSQAR